MRADTYYRATARPAPRFEPASGPIDTEVAIVGGGYAGLCTALSLQDRGTRDITILEAEQVGHGASGRNGGFVFAGYSLGEASCIQAVADESGHEIQMAVLDIIPSGPTAEHDRRHTDPEHQVVNDHTAQASAQ